MQRALSGVVPHMLSPETFEASLQLGEMVLVEAGVPIQAASRMIEARRQAEQALIDEQKVVA